MRMSSAEGLNLSHLSRWICNPPYLRRGFAIPFSVIRNLNRITDADTHDIRVTKRMDENSGMNLRNFRIGVVMWVESYGA